MKLSNVFKIDEKILLLKTFLSNPGLLIKFEGYNLKHSDTKFLIFTQYADTAHYLHDNIENSLLITGALSKPERFNVLELFKMEKKKSVFNFY